MELTVVNKLSPQNRTETNEAFVRKHLEVKLGKIEQRWGKPVAVRVTTEEQPVGFAVTVALLGDQEFVARAFSQKLPKAVDAAVDKLTRQFEIHNEKREGRERQRRSPAGKVATEY
ncbi:MAG: hypothetical protein EXR77_18945 [Myxococcales bacterium]|nr:hypothetical protein [Myxococcales bacterium]